MISTRYRIAQSWHHVISDPVTWCDIRVSAKIISIFSISDAVASCLEEERLPEDESDCPAATMSGPRITTWNGELCNFVILLLLHSHLLFCFSTISFRLHHLISANSSPSEWNPVGAISISLKSKIDQSPGILSAINHGGTKELSR